MTETVWFSLRLSLLVASVATIILAVVGIALGYILARGRFPGKNLLDLILTLPLVLPPTVVGYFLIVLLGRRGWLGRWLSETLGIQLVFTWKAAVIASMVVALPLMVKTARSAFEAVDVNLEKISYTLGKSRWETFWKVTLPLARSGVLAGAILAFARAMGEFGATLMVAGNIPGRTTTMPLAIFTAYAGGDAATANYLVVIHTVMALGVLAFAYRLGEPARKWQ
jgi:molybdate transport system permease protein